MPGPASTQRIDATTVECVRALDAAGIPHLLLKGPTTARWLYQDGTPRPYCDSDLLVPAVHRYRAQAVLESMGFVDRWRGARPEAEEGHAVSLYRPGPDGADDAVDLHHRLGLVTDPATPVWDVLSRDVREFDLDGHRVRMPGETARCLVLALQAAQDGPTGRKALEDLRRGRRLVDEATWSAACALAAELGAEQEFRLGCGLVGAPVTGEDAANWSDLPLDLRLRVKGAARGAAGLAGLRHRRGSARLRYALQMALPTRKYMAEVYGARTTRALMRAHLRRTATTLGLLPRAVRDLATASSPPAAPVRDTG
jgi:hypothetical protein